MKATFLGEFHGFVESDGASATPASSVHQRRVEPRGDERALESECTWSQLRDTFEYRDFDDSLVFVE